MLEGPYIEFFPAENERDPIAKMKYDFRLDSNLFYVILIYDFVVTINEMEKKNC